MQLLAVLLARTLAFCDINELNPRGKVFFPDMVPVLVERFNFQQFPSKPEVLDESKGISFKEGYFEGNTIDDLTIYSDGIKIDLRSSTADGKKILIDTLQGLSKSHGITYGDKTISRWNFVSNLSFNSEVDLDFISPALQELAKGLTDAMKDDKRVSESFHVESVQINLDGTFGKKQISPMIIQRRANAAFSEGKYFSAAPTTTDIHIALLEKFEESLRRQ